METRRDMIMLYTWGRICRMEKDRLTRRVYDIRKNRADHEKSWCYRVKQILHSIGLEDKWESEEVGSKEVWKKKIKALFQTREEEKWKGNVGKSAKLKIYNTYKNELKMEEYIHDNANWRGKQILTRLRTGNSFLEIEQGRHKNIPRERRVCPVCKERTEDEKHFLVECKSYKNERRQLYYETETKPEETGNDEEKVVWILNPTKEKQRAVKKFLLSCFTKRQRLLANPNDGSQDDG
jgi:hypothetical protein